MNMTLIILAVCLLIAVGLITVYFIFGHKNSPFKFDIGGGSPRAAGGAVRRRKRHCLHGLWD